MFLIMIVVCDACGEQVQIWRRDDTTQIVVHSGCAHPSFQVVVHHPRRLGVISSWPTLTP